MEAWGPRSFREENKCPLIGCWETQQRAAGSHPATSCFIQPCQVGTKRIRSKTYFLEASSPGQETETMPKAIRDGIRAKLCGSNSTQSRLKAVSTRGEADDFMGEELARQRRGEGHFRMGKFTAHTHSFHCKHP